MDGVVADGGGFHRVSQAGPLWELTGLPPLRAEPRGEALRPGRAHPGAGRAATPWHTSRRRRTSGSTRSGKCGRASSSTAPSTRTSPRWRPTTSSVNLTRFDLFFPEKRDFFLENAGIFDFGWRGFDETPPFLMFFSRRIGIAKDDESPIPVRGGRAPLRARGPPDRGLPRRAARDRGAGQPAANYGCCASSATSAATTTSARMVVDRRDEHGGNTAGRARRLLLARRRPSTFRPSPPAPGLVAAGGDSGGLAGERRLQRRSLRPPRPSTSWSGPDADPQVGFVTRTDIRRTDVSARYTVRPSAFGSAADRPLHGRAAHRRARRGEKQDVGAGPVAEPGVEQRRQHRRASTQGSTPPRRGPSISSDRVTVPAGRLRRPPLVLLRRLSRPARPVTLSGGRRATGLLRRPPRHRGRDGRGAAPGSHLTPGAGLHP